MNNEQKPTVDLAHRADNWIATVRRGDRKLYVTPYSKTQQEARQAAQAFLQILNGETE